MICTYILILDHKVKTANIFRTKNKSEICQKKIGKKQAKTTKESLFKYLSMTTLPPNNV